MVKKLLLFIFLVTCFSSAFAQQNQNVFTQQEKASSIKSLIASPNPFSVTTKIKFQADAVIEFSVKDLIGNTVFAEKYTTKVGTNSIIFYRDKLDSGIYIYSIKTASEIVSKRIVIK